MSLSAFCTAAVFVATLWLLSSDTQLVRFSRSENTIASLFNRNSCKKLHTKFEEANTLCVNRAFHRVADCYPSGAMQIVRQTMCYAVLGRTLIYMTLAKARSYSSLRIKRLARQIIKMATGSTEKRGGQCCSRI